MSNLFSKIYQGRNRTSPSVFQPMLPFQQLARKAILSILQKPENVKFILQKFPKKADFAESPFTGDIKYTTNFCKCQTDFV